MAELSIGGRGNGFPKLRWLTGDIGEETLLALYVQVIIWR